MFAAAAKARISAGSGLQLLRPSDIRNFDRSCDQNGPPCTTEKCRPGTIAFGVGLNPALIHPIVVDKKMNGITRNVADEPCGP
jgi:hypothetical protein